jgi:hypothetical protein
MIQSYLLLISLTLELLTLQAPPTGMVIFTIFFLHPVHKLMALPFTFQMPCQSLQPSSLSYLVVSEASDLRVDGLFLKKREEQ